MPRHGGGGGGGGRNKVDRRNNADKGDHSRARATAFKTNGKFKFHNDKKFNKNINARLLLDSDVDMSGLSQPSTSGRGGGNMRRDIGRRNFPQKKFITGPLPWYQIIIPYGAKHERDTILKALLSYLSPHIFIPHYYKVAGNSAMFYVDDAAMAEKLFYADRKISLPDGFKMLVIVKNTVPHVNIDNELKEKMKMAMVKRYNPATKAMDLTKFHADPDLTEVFCGLFRKAIMLAIVDIIAENIPDLEALNLNDNKLHSTDHLKVLPTKLPTLKVLYLGENKIPHISFLEPLKGLKLTELFLKGNPVVSKYGDEDAYVSDVRKVFPKLTKLDGVELPPAIQFDLGEELQLPPPQQTYLDDPAGQEFLRVFLTQYYAIYDSESRQPLLEAYHEHATMSLTANSLLNDANRNAPSSRLNAYLSSSRNLLRLTEREARRRHLRSGRLHVVGFLADLPRTKHDLVNFKVDLSVYTPQLTMVTLNGVFREPATEGTPLRAFQRTFLIVPNGAGGFCVANDMLFVTNASAEQAEKAFVELPAVVVTPPAALPAVATAAANAVPPEIASDPVKSQMVMMVSQQTGMNVHWSINCLQEMSWDLQRAGQAFLDLHAQGKIPPEAFVR